MDIRFAVQTTTLVALLLVQVIPSDPVAASDRLQQVQERLQAVAEREAALSKLGSDVQIRYGDHGSIAMITGNLDLPSVDNSALSETTAELFSRLRLPLGFVGAESLVNPRVRDNGDGSYYLQLDQAIDGISVVGTHLTIGYGASGDANVVSARLLRDAGLPRTPSVTRIEAAQVGASAALPEQVGVEVEGVELVYLHRRNRNPELVWQMFIEHKPIDGMIEEYRVFVDAHSADVLAVWPLNTHGKKREVYDANNQDLFPNDPVVTEGGTHSDTKVMKVYDHLGTVYDFFVTAFSRTKFIGAVDPQDSSKEFVRGIVKYCPSATCPNWNNAGFHEGGSGFPDDSRLQFGNGDPDGTPVWGPWGNSLDVVAHEYMHGITRADKNLGSSDQGEAGAINEAYSDIFAAVVDAHENGLTDATWLFAEDVYDPDSSAAIRVLKHPTKGATGNPMDDYLDSAFTSVAKHDKAGVANLAFHLLVEGGYHPRAVTSNEVQPIGMVKARNVFYNALPLLRSNNQATFAELRTWTADRANVFYGATEANRVHQAFDAVRVNGSPNFPPEMPASISANSWYCYGWYTISWPEVLGANSYDLRHKENIGGDYLLGTILYVGTATSVDVNVESTGYVGVRACNASGCSDFQGTAYVERQGFCQ